jgi:nucleoside-diphosphate-sugar epimerase
LQKILISGASGFIGKALCKKMLRKGWEVRGAVRFEKLMHNLPDGVKPVFIGSIGPNTEWGRATSNIDMVVHLAAQVHKIRNDSKDPFSEYRCVNVEGTKFLARAAADNGIKRFVYLSTVKVNGEGKTTSYNEKDKPEPIGPYAVSKWESENVLHAIGYETDLEVVIIRSPLVYGPRVKANFLRLLKVIDRGIPLPLASVNNRRSLIYLENLVDAIITCIKHPKATGQTYLVSDGKDVSTPELIRLISKAMGRKSQLFPLPPIMLKTIGKIASRSAEIDRLIGSLCVETCKIRTMLGWNPPYTPEEGIRKTVLWYKKYGKGQRTDVRW